MNHPYSNNNSIPPTDYDRGFRKTPLNITFGDISSSDINKTEHRQPSYTYHLINTNLIADTQSYITGEMQIKSPQSLTSFTKINFSQRANNSSEHRASYQTKQSQRPKSKYSEINLHNKIYQPLTHQIEMPRNTIEMQSSQTSFSKYANSQLTELNRLKSNSQFVVPKQQSYNYNEYSKFIENELKSSKKQSYEFRAGEEITTQVQQYKMKINRLEREVTQTSLQKGELIIKVAELQRENSDLKRELRKIAENNSYSSPSTSNSTQGKKIEIDQDLFLQIQNINLQQKEINKIKEEYIKLAAAGYQNEIRKLLHQNNNLTIEIQSLKVDLEMAQQDLIEKQKKIEFLQKQTRSLQQKSLTSSRMSVESSSERSIEVMTLRHSLNALENKYKAVSRQLASNQEYILKYITGRRCSEDLQAIKHLVSTNQFSINSSQSNNIPLNNSKKL